MVFLVNEKYLIQNLLDFMLTKYQIRLLCLY
jgi:hypothetical protein